MKIYVLYPKCSNQGWDPNNKHCARQPAIARRRSAWTRAHTGRARTRPWQDRRGSPTAPAARRAGLPAAARACARVMGVLGQREVWQHRTVMRTRTRMHTRTHTAPCLLESAIGRWMRYLRACVRACGTLSAFAAQGVRAASIHAPELVPAGLNSHAPLLGGSRREERKCHTRRVQREAPQLRQRDTPAPPPRPPHCGKKKIDFERKPDRQTQLST